jgi:murein DD-endopeptidase MepM/ murein hydrolase activator NlpD
VKVLAALVAFVAAALGVLLVKSDRTALRFDPVPASVGLATGIKVEAVNPHGVRRISARIDQAGGSYPLFEQTWPSRRLFFWRAREAPQQVAFEAGKNKAPKLTDGKARLVVQAVSNDLLGRTTTLAADVDVVTVPPRVSTDGFQHYVNQGGMELALVTPSGGWSEAGIRVGRYNFRSFPLPGRPATERFAMFAYPWDLPGDVVPQVYARNQAGLEAQARFWFKLFPKKFRTRDLELTDAFLDKVVHQIDPQGQIAPGPDLLSRFLKINGELRRKNNQQLSDIRFKTEEKMLWSGPFVHWGKEESYFADVRNYIYKGKKVDQQVHLGFDLSDVQNAPVKVANEGRVAFAGDLGIYGNCVVVDHGYALQSIYGHMNKIDVKEGDLVKKNESLGVAGSTGLAGGVHVHFSMQIDGVQVNPMEWWDDHWIRDRILSKLAPK